MSAAGSGKSKIVAELPAACADETKAFEFMERERWGGNPRCPRCESENVYQMKDRVTGERNKNFKWCCRGCGKYMFTVRKGTIFEDSPIPLRFWCYAFWRAATSKKGVAALEIRRQTGLSYKSALFMMHRIRFAMADESPAPLEGDVEVDELFWGGRVSQRRGLSKRGQKVKTPILALVQRGGGVRVKPIPDVSAQSLKESIRQHVRSSSRIMTDQHGGYRGIGREYRGGHHTVNHSHYEFARGDVSTNTVESFFALMRRGLNGIYHSVSKEHLHRYMAEYQFRYCHRKLEDGQRTILAIKGGIGKRLLYREPVSR